MLNTFFNYENQFFSKDNIILTFFKDMYASEKNKGNNYIFKSNFEEFCKSIEILYSPKSKLIGLSNDEIIKLIQQDDGYVPPLDAFLMTGGERITLFKVCDIELDKDCIFVKEINESDPSQNCSYVKFTADSFIKHFAAGYPSGYPDGYLMIRTIHPDTKKKCTNIFGEFIGN